MAVLPNEDVVTTARVLVSSLLNFDPQQDQPAIETRHQYDIEPEKDIVAIAYRYMAAHSAVWTHRRPQVDEILHHLGRGVRVLLHGEKGTGKTTILRFLQESSLPGGEPTFVIHVDFSHRTADIFVDDRHDPDAAVAKVVFEEIDAQIRKSKDASLILKVRNDNLVLQDAKFDPFRQKYFRFTGTTYGNDPEEKQKKIVRDHKELHDELERCFSDYDNDGDYLSKELALLRAASSVRFIVVCLDNIDQLSARAKDAVARCAQAIASISRNRLGVAVACRTEHLGAMQRALDPGKTWQAPAIPIPDTHAWDLKEILDKRLSLLEVPASNGDVIDIRRSLVDDVLLAIPELKSVDFSGQVERFVRQARETCHQLWKTNEPGSHQHELALSLIYWHNGDIRNSCLSISELSEEALDPLYLQSRNKEQRLDTRMRHGLTRHIITGEERDGDGHLRECLRFFAARPESESTGGKFFFLPLRVLTLLNFKGPKLTVSAIQQSFRQFGVPSKRVSEVLNELADRKDMDTGYVRFEDSSGVVDRLVGKSGQTTVELLPAGKYFLDQLVCKVDFLYWNALDKHRFLTSRKWIDGEWFTRLAGRGVIASATEKTMLATGFLVDYLLPKFLQEHPYMEDGAVIQLPEHADRIALFRAEFGFDHNNWFIQRLMASIEAYAKSSAFSEFSWQSSQFDPVRECKKTVDGYVKNLNKLAAMTT